MNLITSCAYQYVIMHPYSAFSFKDYVFDWQKRKNKNCINLFRSQILENRINFSRAYNCTFTVDNKPHALSTQRCRGKGSGHTTQRCRGEGSGRTTITVRESAPPRPITGSKGGKIKFRLAGRTPVMGRGGALSLTVMVVRPLPSPLHRCVVCPLPFPLHRCVDKAWGLLSS